MKFIIMSLILCGFIYGAESQTVYKSVTIEWEIPKKSDVVGYFFSLESESGVKSKSDIGLSRRHTFSVIPDRKYRIYVIPYNIQKTEGPASNIIEYCHTNSPVVISLPKPKISISK